MYRHLNKILLILTCLTAFESSATKPPFLDNILGVVNRQLAHEQRYDAMFYPSVQESKEYSPIDPQGKYRTHLSNHVVSAEDVAASKLELINLDVNDQHEKNAKRFLKRFNLYSEGAIDYDNPDVLNAVLTHTLYGLDRGFYEASYMNYALQDKEYYGVAHQRLLDLIQKDIPTYLHRVYIPFIFKVTQGYEHHAVTTVSDNLKFVSNLGRLMRANAIRLTVEYLKRPELTLKEYVSFVGQFNNFEMLNLWTDEGPDALKPMHIYDVAQARFTDFFANPHISPEDYTLSRRLVLFLSVAHYELATNPLPAVSRGSDLEPFDKRYVGFQKNFTFNPDLTVHLHVHSFKFLMTWIDSEASKSQPKNMIDELYAMALTGIQGKLRDIQTIFFQRYELNELQQICRTQLADLNAVEPLTERMLRIIQLHEEGIEKTFVKNLPAEKIQLISTPAGIESRIVPHPSQRLMGKMIDDFFTRMDRQKQAAIAAEKEALKAKTQALANNLFAQKHHALTSDAHKKMENFINAYPYVVTESFKQRIANNPNYVAFQELLAKGRTMGENQTATIDIQAVKDMTEMNKSLDKILSVLSKDLERMQREEEDAQKALAKAEKKRLKAEAKVQEKAERAKQKAEEKDKRESVKSLAPSPDPAPYPSVGEKRLSVKAEIAEKHKSATLRLVEKEQRKSLRQSVKDLLHIGEADTQKDKRDSKRFSQRSSKRKSEVLDETPEAPLDLSQFGAVDRASIDKETLEIWEGKRVVTHQDAVVEILNQINGATSLQEIIDGFTKGNNFKPLNASSKLKDFKFFKKEQVYSIRVHGKADKHRICFIWDDKEKKARKVQYGTYH